MRVFHARFSLSRSWNSSLRELERRRGQRAMRLMEDARADEWSERGEMRAVDGMRAAGRIVF